MSDAAGSESNGNPLGSKTLSDFEVHRFRIDLTQCQVTTEVVPCEDLEDVLGGIARGYKLLENLAVKATAAMALRSALARSGTNPESLQYVFGSGEEAIGDRYQRGGGNLGKTVAEAVGCLSATGSDVKAFCCGPVKQCKVYLYNYQSFTS